MTPQPDGLHERRTAPGWMLSGAPRCELGIRGLAHKIEHTKEAAPAFVDVAGIGAEPVIELFDVADTNGGEW